MELFTSEGCSSCPPADRLLATLERTHANSADVIALEEHVDYWDHLGWRDPFSSPEFTARQQRYTELLRVPSPYTPQMVIDGHQECVGNDAGCVRAEIGRASQDPKIEVKLQVKERSNDKVLLSVQVAAARRPAEIVLAITETGLSSDVQHGENAGHNLAHAAVVRSLASIGKLKAGETFSAEPAIQIAREWNRENVRAVVFLAERGSDRVLGAAEIPVGR